MQADITPLYLRRARDLDQHLLMLFLPTLALDEQAVGKHLVHHDRQVLHGLHGRQATATLHAHEGPVPSAGSWEIV
jgi:hypothetical protein